MIATLARQFTPHFRHLETLSYAAGGASHRIASFVHLRTGAALQLLPGGRYERGGLKAPRRAREQPHHEVLLRPLLLGRLPLLQAEWDRVPGRDRRSWRRPELPIEGVSWEDARRWLSACGGGLRLPSEAEWEFACRAGTTSAYFWGDEASSTYAWFGSGGAEWGTQPPHLHAGVPNAFGLVDVAGNLAEWCEDHYVGSYHGAPRDGSPRRSA
ncbi:MAG: SUMF1/EgtB/PvdO family nonheme iron enzyme, partial [Planctomycetes bacterium]|nr:SUMF1/EgtB/PvdO family nonheme iron enzyme [Planctomycetota bacterium]